MQTLPTLFVSHGSPMHAVNPGPAGQAWAAFARDLPRPQAILVASAHWETNLPMLTSGAKPATIHDFSGFPDALYQIRYAAEGAPELAADALANLRAAGFDAALNGCRGLDHGAWVPLRWMFPDASVPVLQLSIQPSLSPQHHLRMGAALAPLAARGVLIVGSGHVTHNLRDWLESVRQGGANPVAHDEAAAFQAWVWSQLNAGDSEALADYRERGPFASRAHPTPEHVLPLFVALGAAAAGARVRRWYVGMEGGVLAMDAFAWEGGRNAPPG